jgi:hypothetical protein
VGDLLSQYASEIWSFAAGLVGGGIGGSLLTLRITQRNITNRNGSVVDQSRTRAGGDIVGRDKRSESHRK